MQRRKWTRTAICLAATSVITLTILYFAAAPHLTPARPGKRNDGRLRTVRNRLSAKALSTSNRTLPPPESAS